MKSVVSRGKRVVLDADRVGIWASGKAGTAAISGWIHSIGYGDDDKLIAAILYDTYNGKSICMHVVTELGSMWCRKDFLLAMFSYPFRQLGLAKVLAPVASTNAPCRRLVEHLGFVPEATLTNAHPDGDLIIYSMSRDQCQWLHKEDRHGKEQSSTSP